MGMLIDGQWQTDDGLWAAKDGAFHRADAQFHCRTDATGIVPEKNRYHLYVSLACPWAHRTLIFRHLKDLQAIIPVSIVQPCMLDQGWHFSEPEPLYEFSHAYQLYQKSNPHYSGRVTVPVLWDK